MITKENIEQLKKRFKDWAIEVILFSRGFQMPLNLKRPVIK